MSEKSSVRGAKFFFQLAGFALLAGLIFFVGALIFFKALYAWGILGFFAFLVVIGVIAGWWSDRKAKERRAAEMSDTP